jgi:23S rRNA pseudouridine2605 synthase
MKTERLQKLLSRAGVSSRRKAEELIVAGRVRVGGKVVTELGTRVDPNERVEVDGRRVQQEDRVYIVLHKPRGVMCTMSDPEGRRTVADLVRGVGARVVPVGRLDYHTSGAILLTNDGDFAAVIGHPSKGAPKTYVAKVMGVVDERGLARWQRSIEVDGRRTQPAQVDILRVEGNKTWLEVTLREGRNRQVRRLGEQAGNMVMRLARESVAGISVEGLKPGQWRYLSADELVALRKAYGVPSRVRGVEVSPGPHGRAERGWPDSRSTRKAPRAPSRERAPARAESPRAPRPPKREGGATPRKPAPSKRRGRG